MLLGVDHVCWLVPDAGLARQHLRSEFGFGSELGLTYERAGTQHYNVWLEPPQYLELLSLVDRQAALRTEVGRRVLDCERRGNGLFTWAVLVDDLDAISERTGIEIFDYTLPQADGTVRGWRAVTGAAHLPFFIDYPNNGPRRERLAAAYQRMEHDCAPSGFSALFLEGDEREMQEWLGPHDLPLHFRPGDRGLYAAEIAAARGSVMIPTPG